MKQILLALVLICSVTAVRAQEKKPEKKYDFSTRSGDHLMLQVSSDHWMNVPDSISNRIKGLSRGLNLYFMLDKPFKGNPKMSVAFGLGVSTSNIFFKKTNVDIKSTGTRLPFSNLDTLNHFKKFKLATAFLEIPIELRFSSRPLENNKSLKFAIGAKVGTLLKAQTKGKTLQDRNDRTLNSYTQKESNKRFFNSTRLSATARIGFGMYSLFASYQINNLLKDGAGPEIKPLQVGITISGM
jgi:Outer membrane protein beta-barrel domain